MVHKEDDSIITAVSALLAEVAEVSGNLIPDSGIFIFSLCDAILVSHQKIHYENITRFTN